ncbi:cytoplasmic protein [Rhodotorula toruloides]|uniref:Cytoplasmic protein n=1 Tax=Rhodotorula toruloides TaxID=5286 RepID=A0A511KI75_RHOTO|nr:cytoplasmic protein [Rhodotorula toruloides]
MSAVSSAHQQVLDHLASGDFYSAHQKARTTATRLLAPPRRNPPPAGSVLPYDKKAQEAAELLWDAARKLLENGQTGSGVDLGVMLVEDVWTAREVGCGKNERAKLIQLIALTGPAGAWRKTLTDAIFAWSAKTGSGAAGDVEIHQYMGETFFKEGDYHQASLHLLVCPSQDAAQTLANVMFEWSKLDPEKECGVGRYAARGTLSYLESSFILAARTFLSHFLALVLAAYPTLRVVSFPYPPPSSPLATSTTAPPSGDEIVVTKLASLNFLQLAVRDVQAGVGETVEKVKVGNEWRAQRGAGTKVWQSLVGKYERQVPWMRAPEVRDGMTALGEIHFGLKPQRAGNPLMDMMASMFGGGGMGGR